MTTRWIAVSLAVLALAACDKKDAAKPPPPKPETPAPPSTPPVTQTETPPVRDPTQPSGYRPAKPSGAGYKADDPAGKGYRPARPDEDASSRRKESKTNSTTTTTKVVATKKTPAQAKAETDVVGTWRQQGPKISTLQFRPDGWVSLERGDSVVNGQWTSRSDGGVDFTLPVPGGEAKLVGHPSASTATGKILSVVPSQTGPQLWPGSGQVVFSRK